MAESSLRRILRSVIRSVAEECDEELLEARTLFGNKIKEHLVSPVLQQVYKDLLPYVCAGAAVLIVILVLALLAMFVIVTRCVPNR